MAETNNGSVNNKKLPSVKAQQRKKTGTKQSSTPKIMCVYHGKEIVGTSENFYSSNKGGLFKGMEYMPVCKTCARKIYSEYYHDSGKDYIKALFLTCRKLDLKFDLPTAQASIERANGEGSSAFGWYMQMYGSLKQLTEPSNFDMSDNVEQEGSFEDKVNKIQSSTKLDAEDKRNLKDIKKKLGFDPFEGSGYQEYQLGKMYQELVSYLEDDELASEAWKLNVVLQIIENNQQIRQINLFISLLSNNMSNFEDNMAKLASLNTTKQKLTDANMKIYKENAWITNDTTGRSKLAGMMKKYREYGFDEVEVNYFDMKTSASLKTVYDLSHKSIMDTLHFDSEEMKNIFETQRLLIQEKDNEIAELFEQKRKLAIELVEAKKKLGGVN